MMRAYASRTGTKRNLEAMGRAGWRLICEPSQLVRYGKGQPPLPYALDNGAWGCHQRGVPFDEAAFITLLEQHGDEADWIVLPDIVAGGLASLRFSERWADRVSSYGPVLLAVQDGMEPADVAGSVGPDLGLFLGGSTEWKLQTMRSWGELARDAEAYFHVARVNSVKRIRLCQGAMAHSFDGTSVTRFACNIHKLDSARRQESLFG